MPVFLDSCGPQRTTLLCCPDLSGSLGQPGTHVCIFITESLGCTPCLGISEAVLSLELEEGLLCSLLTVGEREGVVLGLTPNSGIN